MAGYHDSTGLGIWGFVVGSFFGPVVEILGNGLPLRQRQLFHALAFRQVPAGWDVLERHWNDTLRSTAETALRWAQTMTRTGLAPVVRFPDE